MKLDVDTELDFHAVDEIAYAHAYKEHDDRVPYETYVPRRIGPVLELLHLSLSGRTCTAESWLDPNLASSLVSEISQGNERWSSDHMGFIRAVRNGLNGDDRFTQFLMDVKRRGRQVSGLSVKVSGQLVAAMRELENNIHEHAEAAETGYVAFRAEPGAFEFVVADRGIGIRNSLRSHREYADEGQALVAALTDGVSRYGSESTRGYGFRPIFTGLANLQSVLRFRSGDYAVTMDGTNPDLVTARITQKVEIEGFFSSVRCYVTT